MNKRDLKQIYYIKLEIKMLSEKRDNLEQSILKSQKLNGMPRSAKISKQTEAKAIELAEIKEILEELEYRTLVEAKKIYEYIRGIDDSLLRQIIVRRCIDLMPWREVADKVGGNNTEDSVRMYYERHIED